MENPHLSRIRIYPIKSLDPVELSEIEIGMHSLRYDREFAMLANDRRFVNGKRTGRVNQLKAEFDLANQQITLGDRTGEERHTFPLDKDHPGLLAYLRDFFEMEVKLLHNTDGELMDIPRASSVSLVSVASLEALQSDLPGHKIDDLRLRFRANLEISGTEAFWEDQLFGEPDVGIRFTMGDVTMVGVTPRARCNVPPRDPHTGETDKTFVKQMMFSRAKHLPTESRLPKHGNFYHFTVDTYLPESERGKVIRLGDPIKILEPVSLTRL